MLRLLADENLSSSIVRGLLRRNPHIDMARVQDVGLSGADDPTILAWAARNERVVITHDIRSMPWYADRRMEAGEPMAGVFEVPRSVSIGHAIEDLLLLAECSLDGEWDGQVLYLPL